MQGGTENPKTRIITQPEDLAAFIDHTLLKPEATSEQIRKLCREAAQFHFRAVCVNSSFVRLASEELRGLGVDIASVVGFPLGAELSEVKAYETELALRDGATEIDMVLRIGALKEKSFATVAADVAAVVGAAQGAAVKVIIETGLLTTDEIITACHLCENAGARFVKTATGFLGRGATVEDVLLMRSSLSANVRIKASGGVKTFEAACELIRAGADRLGTSSGVALVQGQKSNSESY
jgi:deoxyribose-phosphate aldolase